MKNAAFTAAILFTLISFAAVQSLEAQQTEAFTAYAKHPSIVLPALASAREMAPVAKPTYQLDMSAGQQQAHFEGLEAYFASHLTYPATARNLAVEGKVKILLVVSAEGKVLEAKVVESLGHGCDEAALDLVTNMPDWAPAMNYGIPVKSKKMLEINFNLR